MNVHAKADVVLSLPNTGYIAGDGDGIVTVGGVPAQREIVVFDMDLVVLAKYYSLANGHYLISNLDHNHEYLIMARDYKREYEPAVWDYVRPMSDKTLDEQMELWQSWH